MMKRANEEMAMILAHLNQYKKQKRLLCHHAGDFIAWNIEEVEELEMLEDNECQACCYRTNYNSPCDYVEQQGRTIGCETLKKEC